MVDASRITRNEKTFTLEGEIKKVHIDYEDHSEDAYFLVKSKNQMRLNLNNLGDIPLSQPVKVEGTLGNKELVVKRITKTEEISNNVKMYLGYNRKTATTGNFKIAVVTLQFLNDKDIISNEEIEEKLFSENENSSNSWLKEVSYEKFSISGDVYGPYLINENLTQNVCASFAMEKKAIEISDKDIDFTKYDRLLVVVPNTCLWTGYAEDHINIQETNEGILNLPSYAVTSRTFNRTRKTDIHELMHTFDINHASYLDCTNGPFEICNSIEYGDFFDIMGAPFENGHLNTITKEKLKWLKEEQIITTNEPGEYTIYPIETNDSNVKALKIPNYKHKYFYIEYRQPIGFDFLTAQKYGEEIFQGVQVRIPYKLSNSESHLIDFTPGDNNHTNVALRLNESFTGPSVRDNFNVTLIELTPEYAKIKISNLN